jgi:hypothetical protein
MYFSHKLVEKEKKMFRYKRVDAFMGFEKIRFIELGSDITSSDLHLKLLMS